MPRPKKNLSAARTEKSPPVASPDLWERLAEAEKDLVLVRPPDCFTIAEYAAKRGLDRNRARWALEKLINLGKVKRIQKAESRQVYFQLIA